MSQSRQKTVFFLIAPEHGHINPITGLVHKLVNSNLRVIFYSNEAKREMVERTGAQFRLYTHPTFEYFLQKNAHLNPLYPVFEVLNKLLDFSYNLVPTLLADVVRDQPDMIIYDPLFLPARYMLEVLKKDKSIRQPKTIMFYTSFANSKKLPKKNDGFNFYFQFLMFILWLKQIIFNVYFGIWIKHPMDLLLTQNDNLNIVAVFPELQPMRDLFDDTHKFVGPCIMEKVRDNRVDDTKFQQIMDDFKPVDDKSKTIDEQKLVYISLGTVFNDVIDIIEKILQSLNQYANNPNRKVPFNKLKVVLSLGDIIYDQIQDKIQKGVYQIPDNVFLYRRVPQIEILKRASLFITHAGQNSASEAIQYAVPVICIPISVDQPMVAKRLCDDLKVGISFKPLALDPIKLADSIEHVLVNEEYTRNMQNLSKISRKYNGVEESTRLVIDYLNNDSIQDKKIN